MSPWLFNMLFVLALVALTVFGLFLFVVVHDALECCCLRHALRFCRRNGFEVCRSRVGPAFDTSGIKTEFTVVELDCLDSQKERKLVRLLVWVLGIRKVLSTGDYPESQEEQVRSV
jgi:hypothetical protein